MTNIKDREPKKFIPDFKENRKKPSKNQIVVWYYPTTLGEWEKYAGDSSNQVIDIFKNHITFENLFDPLTKKEIKTGADLMDSLYAPFRPLTLEIYVWILSFFKILEDNLKN